MLPTHHYLAPSLRKWEKSACKSSVICNQAAGFNRLLKIQQSMQSQLKDIWVESKGKSSVKVSTAVDELQYLLDFNSSVCQAMAKSMEHLTDFVFINLANTTLLRRDSYLQYLKAGVKADTLNALRTAPLQLETVYTAPGPSQKKDISPGVADCHLKNCKLKSVKSVSCVTQLSCVKPVSNVTNAVPNQSVGARLQNFWKTWLKLGAGPKVVQILKEGYTLPFRIRPKLTRSPTIISCYANPHRNSYMLEALHQLIGKNAIELVHNQTSLGFFNRLFLVPKPNSKWRPILDLSKLNLFLKVEKFKIETPETSEHPSNKGSGLPQ